MIQADVRDDAVYPGEDRALEPEAVQLLVDLQKYLLVDVLGIALRSGDSKRKPENGFVVRVHQFRKRSILSSLRLANQ